MYRFVTCLTAEHDLRVVLIAALVCIGTALTAFKTYAYAIDHAGPRRNLWLVVSGLCTASGIWATHFLAMLAYQPSLPTGYDLSLTIASLLVAVIGSISGLVIASSGQRWHVAAGGAVIGVGVAIMHFTGMEALEVSGTLGWDRSLVVVSVLIGIGLSMAAMRAFHELGRRLRLWCGGALLTSAICGMHFTAMSATQIFPDLNSTAGLTHYDRTALGGGIFIVISAVLMAGIVAVIFERMKVELDLQTGTLREEVEERRRAEHEITAKRERLIAHQKTLASLMREDAVRSGTTGEAARVLAKVLARETGVERVGVWVLNPAKTDFTHNEVYVAADDRFVLPPCAADPMHIPIMIRVSGPGMIAVDDTSQPSGLVELYDYIVRQTKLVSVMHAPIMAYGNLVGFIVCANAVQQIHWTDEHKLFTATIANLAALVIERQERRRAENEIAAKRERLVAHQTTLATLMREEAVRSGTAREALRTLAKTLARESGVERVGFWLLNDTKDDFNYDEIYIATSDSFVRSVRIANSLQAALMVRIAGRQLVAVDDTSKSSDLSELYSQISVTTKIVSVMYTPINAYGNLVGFISCANAEQKIRWSEEHKLFASTIANLAALVLERQERKVVETRSADSAVRLEQQQSILNELIRDKAFREGTLEESIVMLNMAATRLPAIDRALVRLCDADGKKLTPIAIYDRRKGKIPRIDTVSTSFMVEGGDIATLQAPVIINDMQEDPRISPERRAYWQSLGLYSGVDAPIIMGGRVVGVMCVRGCTEQHDWTKDEVLFATSLANLAALALERHERTAVEARVAEAAERLELQQTILSELTRDEAFRQGTVTESIAKLNIAATRLPSIDRALARMCGEDGVFLKAVGLFDRRQGDFSSLDDVSTMRLSDNRQFAVVDAPVIVDDVEDAEMHSPQRRARWRSLGLRSGIDAPMIVGGRVVGMLCVSSSAKHHWTNDEVLFVTSLANLASLALERHERLRAEAMLAGARGQLVLQQEALDKVLQHETFRKGSVADAVGVLTETAVETLGLDRAAVWEDDVAGYRAVCIDAYDAINLSHRRDVTLVGHRYDQLRKMTRSHQVVTVDDIAAVPAPSTEMLASLQKHAIRARLDAPIILDGRVVGSFAMRKRHTAHAWSAEDRLFAMALANLAAIQFERRERLKIENDLRAANAAAKAANQAKSLFLANMSHEIRTPMNGVFGMTDLLARTELSERQKRLVGTISQSARTLLTIINDILDLSRIEEGKLALDSHEFELAACIEDSVELLAEDARKKGLELNIYIHEEAFANVTGDSGRLRQVLLNLIGNAIKFTNSGEVSVRVIPADRPGEMPRVAFEVRDSGIGIDPAVQARLFQPFMQADSSISRRFGGTGLGLSISRHLVSLMGGSMEIDSTPGKGTRIKFELPMERRRLDSVGDRQGSNLFAGQRILVVDDRETNREIICSYLAACGCQAEQAESADEAMAMLIVAAAQGAPFVMAIIDLVMPVTDGLMLSRNIKAQPKLAGMRLVLLSSMSWTDDIDVVREAGIDRLLHKPIRRGELVSTVTSLLARQQPLLAAPMAAVPREPMNTSLGLKVLVAEDNPVNQVVATEHLANLGCSVIVVDNGLQALAAFEREHFDIILMDFQMPEMDGITATRIIREREVEKGTQPMPIVAVTANAFEEDRQKGVEAGMTDYLSKPFSEQQLAKILAKHASPRVAETTRKSKKAGKSSKASKAAKSSKTGSAAAAGATSPPPAAANPLTDNAFRHARPGLYEKLIRAYLEHAPKCMAALLHAMRKRDAIGLRLAAHSLKSSSTNVGAPELAELCRQLEAAANEQKLNECRPLVKAIQGRLKTLELDLGAQQAASAVA